MAEQPDRIRVWNEADEKMFEPRTIQEMLRSEHNNGIAEGEMGLEQYPVGSNEYGHLVFMRNTGIYAQPNKEYVNAAREEIFAEDLVTHSTEPYVYRVAQKNGCWWALSLSPNEVDARPLNKILNPRIVGNIFENRELVVKGVISNE